MLTTDEAARRLGVKVPTLYAYVSRGLLESIATRPGGAASSIWPTSRAWRRGVAAGARRRRGWPPSRRA